MYEVLILGGISGSIYFYFRNKLLNEKKISEQETITLRAMRDEKIREIEELKKKLPKQLTDEDKEAMKIWGVKYEKFICNYDCSCYFNECFQSEKRCCGYCCWISRSFDTGSRY